jgi:LmbE family N-acetylglucosaminyl deacetylase
MKFTLFRKLASTILCAALCSGGSLAQISGKTLLVVAHPDDEYYFAATIYRIAVELHGTVDELIITNGEGGFRYSTLAEPYYGKALTAEPIGRKELPAIRKEETLKAGKILGIRDHYFLDQKDETFTADANAGLRRLWDVDFITSTIADLIKGKHY